jgi:hypothetical protein
MAQLRSDTVYLPMLFRKIWGYESAFYVQNLDNTLVAEISIDFYDSQGNFTCTFTDPNPIAPNASRGYWMSNINSGPPPDCDPGLSGTGFDPGGWAGNAIISAAGGATSSNIVAIARPHMGTEVAAYSGATSGAISSYLPMLFRGMWGYDSAIYVQNLAGDPSSVMIEFFDTSGAYVCTYMAAADVEPYATRGYWLPYLHCNIDGDFPVSGWAGSARVSTDQNVVVIGRPHLTDGEVVAYNAFSSGSNYVYLPMLFRQYSGNESAVYIQNLAGLDTQITADFFDEESGDYCTYQKWVSPLASGAVWLAGLDGEVCIP